MIKKIIASMFLVILVIGCGSASDKDTDNPNEKKEGEVQTPIDPGDSTAKPLKNEYQTILMENVESSDIMLYKKVAFLSLEFSVRDSTSYSAGKDIYNVSYITSAEPEETYEAYLDYIDDVEEESANEYARDVEGNVGGLPIYVKVYADYQEDLGGYTVSVRISEKPSKFQDDNRYFNDYPELVELYKPTKEGIFYREISYSESYTDNLKTYRTTIQSSASTEEFTTFYTDTYGSKANFEVTEDEYKKIFTWTDAGYDHEVGLTKSNSGAEFIVRATLP